MEWTRYNDKVTQKQLDDVDNPLKWWWSRRDDYPIMSQMAFDILSIPAMSVDLERAFSSAEDTISEDRNRLGEETVAALQCLKQWQRVGLVHPPDGNDEFEQEDDDDEVVETPGIGGDNELHTLID